MICAKCLHKANQGLELLPNYNWPSMTDAYQLRKILKGLIIGPLDKNNGEFSCCCPCLYEEALSKLYTEKTGYSEIYPRKLTGYQTKKHGRSKVHEYITHQSKPAPVRQQGTYSDILRSWRILYQEKGWTRFGRFSNSGQLGVPYALFKAKNVLDKRTREAKWHKARPIAPDIRHPMRVMLQGVGIPMGGPISPGMCNATCAWMEREWLLGIDDLSRKMFAGMRYMDDILLITTKDARFDESKFLKDFQSSSCYWNPMSLEDASNGTYLETTYEVANGKELSHRLKNANETESKVWRYHHYNSRLDYTTKRAILFSTLRKVHKMASNSKQLHISAIAKCKEYIKLHYPVGILKYMCSIMARETANHIWLQVRREL